MPSAFDLSQFDFHLDHKRIATHPACPRDSARLLIVPELVDQRVRHLPQWLNPGDVLVINTTKVFPARLLGQRASGGKVEILLLHELRPGIWKCVGKGLPRNHTQQQLIFSKQLTAQVVKNQGDGLWVVRFSQTGSTFWKTVERIGHVPIPPYLKQLPSTPKLKKAYQTVFARVRGSAAAPTAGLHFTPRLLNELKKRGIKIIPVTLHVGWGTFAPIRTSDIRQHVMHQEWGEISGASFTALMKARKSRGRRVVAVGTTALRVVEAATRSRTHSQTGGWSGWVSTFIKPGDKLKTINTLLTNFHLPKTTLFILVCALLGTAQAQAVYAEALKRHYRWASFGDAMLILLKT